MGRMKQGLLSPQHAHIRLFPNMLDLGAFSDTVNHPCQQQRLLCSVGPMRRLVLYLPTLTYFSGEMNKWVTLLNPNSLTDRITKPSFSGISCLLYCYCASNKQKKYCLLFSIPFFTLVLAISLDLLQVIQGIDRVGMSHQARLNPASLIKCSYFV